MGQSLNALELISKRSSTKDVISKGRQVGSGYPKILFILIEIAQGTIFMEQNMRDKEWCQKKLNFEMTLFMNFSLKQGQSWRKFYIVNLLFSEIGMKGILSSGQPPRDWVLYGYGHAGKFTILQYSVYSWGIADSSLQQVGSVYCGCRFKH